MPMTTQQQVRRQFWLDHQHLACPVDCKPNEPQAPSVQLEFSRYVETLRVAGVIDGDLAGRVTL